MFTQPLIPHGSSPRDILQICDGYYECPKDGKGKRLGPLVGYAARDALGFQLVGDVYANYAKIERFPAIVAMEIVPQLKRLIDLQVERPFVFYGAPSGGLTLAQHLGSEMQLETLYPEKVTTALADDRGRAKTELRHTGRFDIAPGTPIVLVEDVCNNFSTTEQLIQEIVSAGGVVQAIACFLNRSPFVRTAFSAGDQTIPVIALWDEAMPEYEQDDPEVAGDIGRNNVAFKPKDRWTELMTAML